MVTENGFLAGTIMLMRSQGVKVSEILGALIETVKSDIEKKASRELALVRTQLEMAQMVSIYAYENLTPSQILDVIHESYKATEVSKKPPRMEFFPIMEGVYISGMPWKMLTPHEPTALKNHGQNLVMLSSRGGLSAYEAYCVLHDEPLKLTEAGKHAFYSQLLIASVIKWNPETEKENKEV